MKGFQELLVWQKAHALVLAVTAVSRHFPPEEKFSLTSQIRRATTSIPTNLAEGHGRNSDPEFRRFAVIAMGSASEVEYQLILARDLGYLLPETGSGLQEQLAEVQRMLRSFISKLAARS